MRCQPEAGPGENQQGLLFADSLLREATLDLERGDYDAVERKLAKALSLAPKHPGCLACLAVCLAEGQRKFVTAEKLATLSTRFAPRSPHGYFALGRIYTLGSRPQDALKNLRRAARLAPHDLRIRQELAKHQRRQAPSLGFLAKDHPLNAGLGAAAGFLSRDRHLVLVLCMLMSLTVWLSLSLYERSVTEREAEVLAWETRAPRAANGLRLPHNLGQSARVWP
jgi:tetratricopeptide (TPR) repeat protein